MKTKKITLVSILVIIALVSNANSQSFDGQLKLNSINKDGFSLSNPEKKTNSVLLQKPTKKIYFVPGGKIGMFFLQGDFTGHQLIALEVFGKYVGDGFFAELSIPFRFKTSPAFTDIGIDVNVMYPFLGSSNKSEVDPFVGGGLGLHFIGRTGMILIEQA